MPSFTIQKTLGAARLSRLDTAHGTIEGPFFQFVATNAVIRGGVYAEDLEKLGAQVVLSNTYHLHLRPGEKTVAAAGGLHGFLQWSGPMTTDSGGYQVFSLGQHVKVDPDGVSFRSPVDGSLHRLTPEKVIQIEAALGADIIMPLDVCTPFGASYEDVAQAVAQTYDWARRCQAENRRLEASRPHEQALYGIVQGGIFPDLRQRSAESLRELGFFGYSIGGELRDVNGSAMEEGIKMTVPHLPTLSPRYLMGAGAPEDIIRAVRLGVDQFDCVLPVRNARHGKLYLGLDKEELEKCLLDPARPVRSEQLYQTIDMRKSRFAQDLSVFSPGHPVITHPYTRSYVHHLLRTETFSAVRLMVLHNMSFYIELMQTIRDVLSRHGQEAA